MTGSVMFGIPLIGRGRSSSWQQVLDLLAQTLNSVLRQSSDSFSVVICCNEVPEGPFFIDRRIHYLVLPPIQSSEIERDPRADLRLKKRTLRLWAAHSTASYFYNLDADDLVSQRLVEHVLSRPAASGFVLSRGWVLDTASGNVAVLPSQLDANSTFDRWCGSSIIVALDADQSAEVRFDRLQRIFERGHNHSREKFLPVFGRAAEEIEFPAAIYRLNTGGNLSHQMARLEGQRHLSEWIFETAFQPDASLRDEFGL